MRFIHPVNHAQCAFLQFIGLELDKIYYANTREDAKNIDFDDSFIYLEIPKKIDDRKIKMMQLLRDDALKAFEIWDKKVDKVKY